MKYISKFLTASIIAINLTTISIATEVPDIGSPHSKYLSPQQEADIGRQMMQQVRSSSSLITDPEINSYIQSIGNRLINSADNADLPPFTFFVISSPQINAFAAPGGYIGLFTGLITSTKSESELASVMAHEVGHITQSHLARRVAEHERLSVPRMAALIASLLLATQNPEAGSAAFMSTNAASIQHQLTYSRTAEKEADNVGINLLTKSGYNPKGMTDFFNTLQSKHSFMGTQIEYLSTHPLTNSRISEITGRINPKHQWRGSDTENYKLIKIKIDIHQIRDHKKAEKKYLDMLKNDNSFSNRYGYALALLKVNKSQQAEQIILSLIADDTERVPYLITLGQAQLKQQKLNQSYKTYQNALSIYPDNYPLSHHYAFSLLYSGNYQKGLSFIQKQLHHAQQNPAMYQLAADLAFKAKEQETAYEYMGDYYMHNFNQYGLAREQYKKAISIANSKVTASRLDAKITKINTVEKNIKKN